MNISVYGGGNIAHSLAGVVSSRLPVTVFTRRPELWQSRLMIEQSGTRSESRFLVATTDKLAQLSAANLIFIALPQFAIDEAVTAILRFASKNVVIVFVPAPAKADAYARLLIDAGFKVVGFQRVPYISRTLEYGRSVRISENRKHHRLVFSDAATRQTFAPLFSQWFGGSISTLSSFSLFAFNNSNPLLHPVRLVVLFDGWRSKAYLTNPPFYAEWTDESSELYVAADREMREIMVRCGFDVTRDYEDVLSHYEVRTTSELTDKLRSIPSFRQILSPMRQEGGCWVPDFTSRYFTEDVQYGLMEIVRRGRAMGANMPTLEFLVKKMDEITNSV